MKYLTITMFLLVSINISAQKEVLSKNFIRVYNLQDHIIAQGKLKSITNNSIELYFQNNSLQIPLEMIRKIKTRQSSSQIIGTRALIGGESLGLISSIYSKEDFFSKSFKITISFVGGAVLGAITGGMKILSQKSEVYFIDGNEMKLKEFKMKMTPKAEK